MSEKKKMRNIWFFVGWILLMIGFVEIVAGVYGVYFPSQKIIVLAYLHTDIWWGVLIMTFGAVFLLRNLNKYIDV